jgi:ATP-dependent Clp protease, protease subunit
MPQLNRDRRPALIRTPAAAAKPRSRVGVRVQALAPGQAVVDIYGVIGDGQASASDVLAGLRGIEATALEIRINSDGGSAMDGIAIYNDLCAMSSTRDVVITGIAGSAASIIAMAGGTIRMMDGAEFFIHNPWIDCAGDARFHRKIADELDRTAASMRRIYSARTGIPEAEIQALMDGEILLTAQEALDLGFCDEILPLPQGRAFAKRRAAPHPVHSTSERAAVAHLASGLRALATQIRRNSHA